MHKGADSLLDMNSLQMRRGAAASMVEERQSIVWTRLRYQCLLPLAYMTSRLDSPSFDSITA